MRTQCYARFATCVARQADGTDKTLSPQANTISTPATQVVSPPQRVNTRTTLTVVASSFVRRHATGVTIAAFFASAIGLSLAPVPSWLKPTDIFDAEDPGGELQGALFTKPEAIPLPDQQDDQLQATNDPLLLEDKPASEAPEPEVSAGVRPPRTGPWKMPERPQFDAYAARLGLKAAPLVLGCRDPKSGEDNRGCARKALNGFFTALARVERGEASARARVVHFGDSLIASDKISDRVRRRMQERFGSAGRGFLMGKRFNQFQRGNRSGRGSDGWRLDVMTASIKSLRDRHFGFSGASFTAEGPGETLRFEPIGASRFVDLYYLAGPSGGDLRILADDALILDVDTRMATLTATRTSFVLPEGTKHLVVQSADAGPRVYGLTLDAETPGITWTTLGLPGATSGVWLRPDKDEFVRLLAGRDPDLAVVMLGGNDGLMLSKKRTSAETIEENTGRFIRRIRLAVPEVECLLVSPLEAVRAKGGGRLIPKPEVAVVIDILRRVAEREGCGFWDMYASMGGKGSLKRWIKARLMLGDLIHPRSRGSDLLGEMMAEALMRSYDEWKTAAARPGAAAGGEAEAHPHKGSVPGGAQGSESLDAAVPAGVAAGAAGVLVPRQLSGAGRPAVKKSKAPVKKRKKPSKKRRRRRRVRREAN